ncbi:hypothetical protein J2X20_002331 [Pelomonas saccharophila]|uniref:Uncharacterized protein n=1 Tax=Roseateles saccharophilus TaxID=304 RepID=A0ABU1YLG6_ROSSA|nr:hypothetical protein [Roseateles saccharophilus]
MLAASSRKHIAQGGPARERPGARPAIRDTTAAKRVSEKNDQGAAYGFIGRAASA